MSVLLAAVLVGCGGKPFEYHSGNEIPKGPGLFSGEDGAFVLHSDKKGKADQPSTVAANQNRGASGEFREFQEFQEFRRWKETAKHSPEYREFQDWREWKQYKTWKENQPR